MLTGLIFATEEAEHQPGVLAATLPFGGMSLIEYQARLLIAAGAAQLLVAVGRMTPALAAAVNRIGRRGTTVDIVRSAEEAKAKAHPLAVIVALADGLVTTDAVVANMALEPVDTLLVTPTGDATSVERVDSGHCWAGVATLSVDRLEDAARLPREYDFQSTLLRVATQARAKHVLLPAKAARSGHGVERDAGTLEVRSKDVLASLAEQRTGWIDRFVFTPVTRLVLPLLVRRKVPDVAVGIAGGVLGLFGLAAIPFWDVGGAAVLLFMAMVLLSAGSLLGWLRGEDGHAALQERGLEVLGVAGILGIGMVQSLIVSAGTAAVLALTGVVVTILTRRIPASRPPWAATAATALVLVAPFALAGIVTAGLALVAVHAGVTLASAIEHLRRRA
ncbi:hypothetical protein ASE90_02655 [Sphingomonas sp. Leaf67]|uniref:hypothetical protein n=1 Tax=Sphingomonas sp. Leaf67 TaxID=1736230 RepID=UPI0006FACB5F|nr:hypothetical protein [Sphingomonas sp. Leaf67]KQN91705.1 hypothetical protein ASE90_02655 [Sphingomonas sp. Leaf67]